MLVPTVLNKSKGEATKILTTPGSRYRRTRCPERTRPSGQGHRAGPDGRISRPTRDRRSTITYTIGLGTAPIPDVSGKSLAEAKKTLKDAGFKTKTVSNSTRITSRTGIVIGTDPPAGTRVERGQSVTILVSSGPNLVKVPSVVGVEQDVADTQIRDAGLKPRLREAGVRPSPRGRSSTRARARERTSGEDTTVTVVVSNGAGTVIVPNVVGESQDAATSDLRAAGLSARVVKQTTTRPERGRPGARPGAHRGDTLPRGEAVTIIVGKFKEPTTTTTTTTTTTSSTSTTP